MNDIMEVIRAAYEAVISALTELGVNFDLDVEGFLDKLYAFFLSIK